ncbi:GNAT family N-acetyltransferase [Rhodoplanes sp. Z2-YC6860]|uniref:GNAT family N-acetyltransferase n=1 Tax=Rhodoplanes sp. Z2-YC6860 TaxID=674703 RepID=UPI00078DAD4A|nr:GNAT family N-acetyltransferase [Rhodoplanes sp. Z2-YC6860]AMN39408.1 cellulose biosynthesis protein CelD [Rhodoplanes sp. Z2-YC6860]
MPQATQAAFDARVDVDDESLAGAKPAPAVVLDDVRIATHGDLASVEREWRAFEQVADCTVFQSFDWVSIWQRHIGERNGVVPAIVTVRDTQGQLMCLLPLGIEPGVGRRLTWLGTVLCDYNAPLLAPNFGQRIDEARFKDLWAKVCRTLQADPRFRFDVVYFDKMQKVVGSQANPFMVLGVMPHANGAYLTALGADWESFYAGKRSSDTRRRDRTKRKKLSQFGELRFVTATGTDIATSLATLMEQKSKAFAAMGVTNIFALPGYRDFYNALAQRFAHASRLDVGVKPAAVNLGLIFRGSYYHLLASYDGGELSKYGPGAAHMHHLLQYAIEQRCHTFDFTIGDERYKQEWSDSHIVLYDHIAPATLRGAILAARLYAVGRVKHFIKQNPALWDKAYKLRAALGALKRRG